MAWARGGPADPKYATREHRELSAHYKRQIRAGHVLECMAVECVMGSRAIVNPNGMDDDGVTVGHCDDGVTYRGPEHRRCNLLDAARRANRRSRGVVETARRWVM